MPMPHEENAIAIASDGNVQEPASACTIVRHHEARDTPPGTAGLLTGGNKSSVQSPVVLVLIFICMTALVAVVLPTPAKQLARILAIVSESPPVSSNTKGVLLVVIVLLTTSVAVVCHLVGRVLMRSPRPDADATLTPAAATLPPMCSPPSATASRPPRASSKLGSLLHSTAVYFFREPTAKQHEERRWSRGQRDQTTPSETRMAFPSVTSSHRSWALWPVRKTPSVPVKINRGCTCQRHPNAQAHASHHHKMYHCWSDQSIVANDIILLLLGVSQKDTSNLVLTLADTLRDGTLKKPNLIFNKIWLNESMVFPAAQLEPGASASNGENGDQQRPQTPGPVLYFLGTKDGRGVWALDTTGFLDTSELEAAIADDAPPGADPLVRPPPAADLARRTTCLGDAVDAIAELPHFTSVVMVHPGSTASCCLPENDAVRDTFFQMVPDSAKRDASLLVMTRSTDAGDVGDLSQVIAARTGLQFKQETAGLASKSLRDYYANSKAALLCLLAAVAALPNHTVDTFKRLPYLRKLINTAVEELQELSKLQRIISNDKVDISLQANGDVTEAQLGNLEDRMVASELRFEKTAIECQRVNKAFHLKTELAPHLKQLGWRRDPASARVFKVLKAALARQNKSA